MNLIRIKSFFHSFMDLLFRDLAPCVRKGKGDQTLDLNINSTAKKPNWL